MFYGNKEANKNHLPCFYTANTHGSDPVEFWETCEFHYFCG